MKTYTDKEKSILAQFYNERPSDPRFFNNRQRRVRRMLVRAQAILDKPILRPMVAAVRGVMR